MHKGKILVTRSMMPPYEEFVEAIKPLWDSRWLTNMGLYHEQLEDELKMYLDVPELSLMVNGHMALELAIQAMNFPLGSEVITTPFTFISTTHAIVRNNLKPVFCDVKETDGTIDESKIEALITDKTVAIFPVHVYGHICNVEEIDRIAKKHGLKVIYDAAHAFGEKYKGRGIGNYGDASIFSFHATKVFHTIEGGAVTFSNLEMYDRLYNLKNFGIRGEEQVVEVGANAKMNEFSAIMGLCNLKYIDEIIQKRKERYEYYKSYLELLLGIKLFSEDNESTIQNYAYMPIRVTDECGITRDGLYDKLQEENIYARKYFYPLTCDQECYQEEYNKVEVPTARMLANEIMVLPFHGEIEHEVIREICMSIKRIIADN